MLPITTFLYFARVAEDKLVLSRFYFFSCILEINGFSILFGAALLVNRFNLWRAIIGGSLDNNRQLHLYWGLLWCLPWVRGLLVHGGQWFQLHLLYTIPILLSYSLGWPWFIPCGITSLKNQGKIWKVSNGRPARWIVRKRMAFQHFGSYWGLCCCSQPWWQAYRNLRSLWGC